MRLFSCPRCPHLVYFENTSCLRCGAALGFDPASRAMRAVDGPEGLRRCRGGDPGCTWLVPAGSAEPRCVSCVLTVRHPGPDDAASLARWGLLERAKRRLLHTLLSLGLPLDGLTFAFPEEGMTGHADGLVTVVLAEADDAERERRRVGLGEPYRTLIGHLRHESGHFYWDRLVRDGAWLEPVRATFGDDRADYRAALAHHYAAGPPPGWQERHISAYAAAHPWEDWAESWAHYLHMVDALEIATAYHLTLAPTPRPGQVAAPERRVDLAGMPPDGFDAMLAAWFPLTHFANSLNRSIGQHDWYPFSLADATIAKLRLVHRIVAAGLPTGAVAA
jgi:hypothetical protein